MKVLATSSVTFDNSPEFIIAELKREKFKMYFAVVYRRPPGRAPFHFFNTLSTYLANYNHIVVTGDFNANLSSDTLDYHPTTLKELIDLNCLKTVSLKPTCHRLTETATHTTLDLFIVNSDIEIHSFSQSESPFIDCHDWIELIIKCPQNPNVLKTTSTRRLDLVNSVALNMLVDDLLDRGTDPVTTSAASSIEDIDAQERVLIEVHSQCVRLTCTATSNHLIK